jgi:S-adenosylmethionine hydrolase
VPEEVPVTGAAGDARRPVVSLLTDFGAAEPFVGLVKARILAECPDAALVDLTHELPAYAIEAAGFWIERVHAYFPSGTVHLCVVDPGVGTARRILLAERGGQRFLAPDNGLLSSIAGHPETAVRAIDPGWLELAGLGRPSPTFHGRDLFAPLAGRLAAGGISPEQMGPVVTDWQRLDGDGPERGPFMIRGRVLFADRFGNLFSNIELESLMDYWTWGVHVGGAPVPWVRTYGEAAAGSLVALQNSFGVLEIACVAGSAAALTELKPGASIELRRPGSAPRPGY